MKNKNTPYIIALITLLIVLIASIAFMALAGKYRTQPVIAYSMTVVFVVVAAIIIKIVINLCKENQGDDLPIATDEVNPQKKTDSQTSETTKMHRLFGWKTKKPRFFEWKNLLRQDRK